MGNNYISGVSAVWSNYSESDQQKCIKDIRAFISDKKLPNILLRLDQISKRYSYIAFIISDPLKNSERYRYSKVTGIFYQDLTPEINEKGQLINFKQDLILYTNNEYYFVIGEGWFKYFPILESFRGSQYIWNEAKFKGEIGTQGKYGFPIEKGTNYNHHYCTSNDLPEDIKIAYEAGNRPYL